MADFPPQDNLYARLDRLRRQLGAQLDAMGLGPLETPWRRVPAGDGVTLRGYARTGRGPVLLLVPAPIKQAYLWDLAPWASVVRRCLSAGVQVYLVQWQPPGVMDQERGLAEYADTALTACADAVRAETGADAVFVAGHSLGGTCAALFAALHPQRVKGLILVGAPVCFGPEVGALGPAVAKAPDIRALTARVGNVPGSLLNSLSVMAAPGAFNRERLLDWLHSLADPQAMWTHILVERWSLDEMPLPRRLFEEVVEGLYREDRFMQGSLTVGGRPAAPGQVSAPVLCIADRDCDVVPPAAMLPFLEAVASGDTQVLWYEGDVGVALRHVGALVGDSAQQRLWPAIIRWIEAHDVRLET